MAVYLARPAAAVLMAIALSAPAQAQPAKSWKFNAGATPELSVENVTGSIDVQGGAGTETVIEADVTGGDEADRARWTFEVTGSGSTVSARVCCGPCNGGSNCSNRSQVDLRVRVPAGCKLVARAVSADVRVQGLSGDPRIETVSGDVKLSGGRQATVKTVSGDLKAERLGGLTVETVSGDVTLQATGGETRARTISGDVDWIGTCGSGCRITAKSTSGDLHLRLAPSSSAALKFRSTSGDLKDSFGATGVSGKTGPGGGTVSTTIGGGAGAIEFSSISGDLRLTKQ